MNRISNSPQLSAFVGDYVDLQIDGITKKYLVRRANKYASFKNVKFTQDSEIESIVASEDQECLFCENPNTGKVFCLAMFDSCGDWGGIDLLLSEYSPKKHEVLINGVKCGEFAIDHLELTTGYTEGAFFWGYGGQFGTIPIWYRVRDNYVPIDVVLLIFSTDTSLTLDQTDLEQFYISNGNNVKTVFVNPSSLIGGDNELTLRTKISDWPYFDPPVVTAPAIQYFYKYGDDKVLQCQNFRQCTDYPFLCDYMEPVGNGYNAFTWSFFYNGNDYVACFATTTTEEPTTTIGPPTTTLGPPTTTLTPTTTVGPTTTMGPTTTVGPTTTIIVTTTIGPTTTYIPTTTIPPTTIPPTTMGPTTTVPPTTTPSP